MQKIRVLVFLLVTTLHFAVSANDFYNCKKEENLTLSDLTSIPSVQPLKIGPEIKTQGSQEFDISVYKGKTVVFLVSATWCGYCKYDIIKTAEWRNREGWPKNDVVVIHMIVPSKRQDLAKTEAFLANPMMKNTSMSLDGIDYYYSSIADFVDFKAMENSSGDLLFPGLRGTPYAIIFDRDGIARFRGHYTRPKDHSAYFDEHYEFIGTVASGQCNNI